FACTCTLSLHDALPSLYRVHDKSLTIMNQVRMKQIHRYIIERHIARQQGTELSFDAFMQDFNDISPWQRFVRHCKDRSRYYSKRSEEHTSELQSREKLV